MIGIVRSWAILLCLTASSQAENLPRKYPAKPLPAELQYDFAEAMVAWTEHDYGWAYTHLQGVNNKQETPEAWFDLGVLAQLLEHDKDELEAFHRYLELVPNAPDRAAVERALAALNTPTTEVTIGLRDAERADPHAVILVDGVIVGNSLVTMKLPRKSEHLFERIQPGHYARDEKQMTDRHEYVALGEKRSSDKGGNVLITANDGSGGGDRTTGTVTFRENERFKLPVGHYELKLDDYCTAISFDVASENELTYVYIPTVRLGSRTPCRKTDGYKVQRLLKGMP